MKTLFQTMHWGRDYEATRFNVPFLLNHGNQVLALYALALVLVLLR